MVGSAVVVALENIHGAIKDHGKSSYQTHAVRHMQLTSNTFHHRTMKWTTNVGVESVQCFLISLSTGDTVALDPHCLRICLALQWMFRHVEKRRSSEQQALNLLRFAT